MIRSSILDNLRFTNLANLGFSVFPLMAREKRPSLNWKRFQTELPSPDELRAWEASNLNVGVACGPLSNIMVLDVDSEEAQHFVDALDLPATPRVRTARGQHLYFRYPASGLRNAAKLDGLPLDARGDGGYVVGPGSVHPNGDLYDWIVRPSECEFSDLPDKVLAALFGERPQRSQSALVPIRRDTSFVEVGRFSTYLNVTLNQHVERLRSTTEGGRNDALNRSAFQLACDVSAIGCDWSVVATPLRNVALEIGLSPSEIEGTLGSALKGGERSPSQWIRIAKDWIYVALRDRFLCKRDGRLIRRDAFNVMFDHVPFPKGLGGELGISASCGFARFLTGAELVDKALDMVFEPSETDGLFERDGQTYFNTYAAPDIEEATGDATPFAEFLSYLIPDSQERTHLLNMIAWTVRNPGRKLGHALLFRSRVHGVGKTTLVNVWRKLLGWKNTRKTNSEEMAGNFQSYVSGTLLVVLEELNLGKGYREYNRLKDLITGETAVVNEKFVPTYEAANFANFVFLSNIASPLMIDAEDRRFFVLDSPAEKREGSYWRGLHSWLDENLGVVLGWLSEVDLANFDPNAPPPITAAKSALIASSQPPVVQELRSLIEDAEWPFTRDIVTQEEVRAALREEGYNLPNREVIRALKAADCVALAQSRVTGRWSDFGGASPRFIEGSQRLSLWACRNSEVWAATDGVERAAEYARKDGLFSELSEFPPLMKIITNLVEVSGRVPTFESTI